MLAVTAAIIDAERAPAWLQLIPSTMTLGGVIVAYLTIRTNTANRRDDEASHARLLVLENATEMYSHGANQDVHWTIVATLRNASSTECFTNINVEGVTLRGYGCQQTIRDWIDEGHDQKWKLLEPGASLQSGWVLPKPGYLIEAEDDEHQFQIRFTYTDGNGRRWRRLDALEPKRIRGNESRVVERNALFESRMRARPNGGDRTLPIEIDVKVRSAFPHSRPDEA